MDPSHAIGNGWGEVQKVMARWLVWLVMGGGGGLMLLEVPSARPTNGHSQGPVASTNDRHPNHDTSPHRTRPHSLPHIASCLPAATHSGHTLTGGFGLLRPGQALLELMLVGSSKFTEKCSIDACGLRHDGLLPEHQSIETNTFGDGHSATCMRWQRRLAGSKNSVSSPAHPRAKTSNLLNWGQRLQAAALITIGVHRVCTRLGHQRNPGLLYMGKKGGNMGCHGMAIPRKNGLEHRSTSPSTCSSFVR
mmetsp:Transcript_76691/g.135438  ORF Transcript_76691/g.135438 Transcript_76691/m.135438 type:complete len:249 (+) Transcript_76691:56-802(+)